MKDFFRKLGNTASETLANLKRSDDVSTWLTELADARKRFKDFVEEGARCVTIYEQAKKENASTPDYNILYANTETLGPAIYSALPRPLVRRRFSDKNEVADQGARVISNTLSYLIKCHEEGYSPFDDLMKSARDEALVPGWGATRFRIDAEVEDESNAMTKEMTICGDEVPWDRLLMGYGKKWAKVPWVAFEHFLTREELAETFGEDLGSKIPLNTTAREDGDKPQAAPPDAQGCKFSHVYEIWDKRDKKVKFISEGYPTIIKEVEDPLGLELFFPVPRPMQFTQSISSMNPRPLYLMYENQAKELNDVTRRIGKITRAMKVRGIYDSTIGDIQRLFKDADDTELIPATNVVALQDGKGLQNSIWLAPLNEFAQTLNQLYINREGVKKVIYEITGIADIMRGSSAASETLGAQQMKQQWGGMRLKTYRDEVARYAVDCLKLMAELACNKYSVEQFKAITGILLPMKAERDQAIMQLQQIQQQAQMQQQPAAPPQGQPGMPPGQPASAQSAPPQADPMQSPQAKQLMQIAQSPVWEEVVAFIKDELHRNYAIQIETNSTLAEELAEDRDDLAQFMQAMGTFVANIMKQVQEQILPFDVAKAMILTICQKFRIGVELEEQIKEMQVPPVRQPGMDPKTQAEVALLGEKLNFEKQHGQMQLAMGQQKMVQEKQHGDLKIALEQERMALERKRMAHESALADHEHALAMQAAGVKHAVAQTNAHTQMVTADSKQQQAIAAAELAQQQPQGGA